jgi:hypothetical protein
MIRNVKKNSNLRNPNLSKNRKVNVSVIVISTPAYNGILKKTKCYHIQNVIIQKRLGEI